MSRETLHFRSCAIFFRHSAVLSLPAVLLRKVPLSNMTGASDDDVKASGTVGILFWFDHVRVFALRAPLRNDVPVLLLN